MKWFKRSGERVPRVEVEKAKAAYARGKRTGRLGGLKCSIQQEVADSIDKMTLIQFANYSGQFTYRLEKEERR